PEPGGYYMASFELDPNGVPYMTYTSGSKAYVVKYENNAWVPVGTAGFPVEAYGPSDIAFDSDGTPYVAYIDSALGNSVTLMKYENMSWSVVEYAGISVRNKYTNFVKLNIDSNDNIYVNFIVNTSNITSDGKETVMMYVPDLH
ncbi:hypothetical protein AB4Z21_14215, partial [Paenibacillus sp. MCAF20]